MFRERLIVNIIDYKHLYLLDQWCPITSYKRQTTRRCHFVIVPFANVSIDH